MDPRMRARERRWWRRRKRGRGKRTTRMPIRDVSKLITPPEGRKKTKTYVEEENWERIKTYIVFELDRGGQVLLVVPRIEMVDGTIDMLTKVLAGRHVRIAEAHSDLEERNSTIDEFSRGAIDVLVATTLLENGVDIPKLNTLIVLDMHRFGAASLHQLRGRVGRRNSEARAYLLHPPLETLAVKTTSRLDALHEILELGSGWSLAEDDMERRGAGNLLGTEQKGKGGWEGVEADEFGRIVEEAMRAIEEMVKEGFEDEEGDDDDEELGGLLTKLGAVPFEHNEPDATCEMADTLASWRRAKAEGGKPPKAPVPWEGKAVEYAPDASTQALPPIWAGGVGAVRRAPSSASARLLARPGGGNAPRGDGWGGGLVGSRVWRPSILFDFGHVFAVILYHVLEASLALRRRHQLEP
jgi:hypothetical protein